jgi:hypothetical protein
MKNNNDAYETMQRYAEFANERLMEHHCGVLPHPDGWVVFGNLGREEKTLRFIELLQERCESADWAWNDDEGPTFAMMVFGLDEPDLMQLWGEACAVNAGS